MIYLNMTYYCENAVAASKVTNIKVTDLKWWTFDRRPANWPKHTVAEKYQ